MKRRNRRVPDMTSTRLKQPSGQELEMFRRQQALAEIGLVPMPLRSEDIPVDLRKRLVQEYGSGAVGGGDDLMSRIARGVDQIASTQVLSRGLLGRNYTIGLTATSIARAERLRGYLFLNPTASVGLTTSINALASTTVTGAGNTQADSIGVATFRSMHILVDLTDTDTGTTTLTLNLDVYDPQSLKWATGQQILSTATVGTYYIAVDTIGVATDASFSWTLSGGSPTATFSITAILKDGLAGSSSSGLANTVYIGPSGVTTTSGYPLLEGQQQAFYLKENLELFAIADIAGTPLRVFEL